MKPSLLDRARALAHRVLGKHYATVIDVTDRAVTAFGVTVAGQAVAANLLDSSPFAHIGEWRQIGLAGIVAGISVIKSAVLTSVTGVPALLSPVSRTLRVRREQPAPLHHVPVRPRPRHPMPVRMSS